MLFSLFFFLLQFVCCIPSKLFYRTENTFCYLDYGYDKFETIRQEFEQFFKQKKLKMTRKEFDTEKVIEHLEKACQKNHPRLIKIVNRMWFTLLPKMLVELDKVIKRVGCTDEVAVIYSSEHKIISNYLAYLGILTSALAKEIIDGHITSLYLFFHYYPEMRIRGDDGEFFNQYRIMEHYFYDLFLPQYQTISQKFTDEYTLQKAFQRNEVMGSIYNSTLNCEIFSHENDLISEKLQRGRLVFMSILVIIFGLVMVWYFQSYTQSLYEL